MIVTLRIAKQIYLLLVFSLITHDAFSQETVKFALPDTNLSPYILGTGKLVKEDRPGIVVDLIMLVGEDMDIEFELVRFPMQRAKQLLSQGNVDVYLPLSHLEEREKLAVFPTKGSLVDPSRRLIKASYALYTLKNSEVTWNGSAIENLKKPIGINRGYSAVQLFSKNYEVEAITSSTTQNLNRLLRHRISAVIDIEGTVDAILRQDPVYRNNIVKLHPIVIEKDYFAVFSKNFLDTRPGVAESIWISIKNAREQYLPALMRKYSEP